MREEQVVFENEDWDKEIEDAEEDKKEERYESDNEKTANSK